MGPFMIQYCQYWTVFNFSCPVRWRLQETWKLAALCFRLFLFNLRNEWCRTIGIRSKLEQVVFMTSQRDRISNRPIAKYRVNSLQFKCRKEERSLLFHVLSFEWKLAYQFWLKVSEGVSFINHLLYYAPSTNKFGLFCHCSCVPRKIRKIIDL